MMQVSSERRGAAVVIDAKGRVDGSNAGEFQDALEADIGDDSGAVVLNLAGLEYISSAGLRVILLTAKRLRKGEIDFAISSLSPSVHELFVISGFDQIIAIHNSPDAALASFEG